MLDCSRPCSSAGHRFRKLVRINPQTPDTAGGVHVGKDDLDVGAGDQIILFGYAGDETGETKMKSLMIGLGASSEPAILYELKLGEVVTTIRASGFGVETVEYKNMSFTVWSVGGLDKIRSLWRQFCPGTHGPIYVVNSVRNKATHSRPPRQLVRARN